MCMDYDKGTWDVTKHGYSQWSDLGKGNIELNLYNDRFFKKVEERTNQRNLPKQNMWTKNNMISSRDHKKFGVVWPWFWGGGRELWWRQGMGKCEGMWILRCV